MTDTSNKSDQWRVTQRLLQNYRGTQRELPGQALHRVVAVEGGVDLSISKEERAKKQKQFFEKRCTIADRRPAPEETSSDEEEREELKKFLKEQGPDGLKAASSDCYECSVCKGWFMAAHICGHPCSVCGAFQCAPCAEKNTVIREHDVRAPDLECRTYKFRTMVCRSCVDVDSAARGEG